MSGRVSFMGSDGIGSLARRDHPTPIAHGHRATRGPRLPAQAVLIHVDPLLIVRALAR